MLSWSLNSSINFHKNSYLTRNEISLLRNFGLLDDSLPNFDSIIRIVPCQNFLLDLSLPLQLCIHLIENIDLMLQPIYSGVNTLSKVFQVPQNLTLLNLRLNIQIVHLRVFKSRSLECRCVPDNRIFSSASLPCFWIKG